MNGESISILRAFAPTGTEPHTKDTRNRLNRVFDWALKHQNNSPDSIDTIGLRDHLLYEIGLAPASVKAHLSTFRVFIREVVQTPAFKESLMKITAPNLGVKDRQQLVELQISRLLQAVEPAATPVEYHREERRNLHLNEEHLNDLFRRINISNHIELRNIAVIALMTGTGIRETEIRALEASDLRHEFEGQLALHVPKTAGGIERYVPYLMDMDWVLKVVETWMEDADIRTGPVFRGFYKSGNLIRSNRLSVTAIVNLLANYPIQVEGQPVIVKPLNLRHLYARHLYSRHEVGIEKMQEYLGIRSLETFWAYIGDPADHPNLNFDFDESKLIQWKNA